MYAQAETHIVCDVKTTSQEVGVKPYNEIDMREKKLRVNIFRLITCINVLTLTPLIYTGAGHIIWISSKSWFISLIPFKKWNLDNVYIHSTQTDIF